MDFIFIEKAYSYLKSYTYIEFQAQYIFKLLPDQIQCSLTKEGRRKNKTEVSTLRELGGVRLMLLLVPVI